MCSSLSPSSLYSPTNPRFLCHHSNVSILNSSLPFLINRRNPSSSLSASITERNLEVSWVSPDRNIADEFNGWAVVEGPNQKNKKKGLPTFVLVGIGSSVIALLVSIAHFSLSRRGFGFRLGSPLNPLYRMVRPYGTSESIESETIGSEALSVDPMMSEASTDSVSNSVDETVAIETDHMKRKERKLGRIVIPVPADSIQQEALLTLKKLKIIEDDVKADELCTRREYARWLVQANSLLERNPKHRIVPSVALLGSTIVAFDDVNVEDPDFISIQALAEAGIVLSKLSPKNFKSDMGDSKCQVVNFSPERFISRQDLINWRAKLDYAIMPGINEEISRRNLGFMDAREISSDALVVLFMDMLASDRSIIRKVFGQGKRFQPNKPSTKAQAAVALTSGRMKEAIRSELLRLKAENSLRQTAMEEIKSELLERGDIQKYWDERLEEEKRHGFQVERDYLAAVENFEKEKIVQENSLAEFLREKAAMDCQKQLLSSLKVEVDEMSERLASEMAKYTDEQRDVQSMRGDLQGKYEGVLDTKSILEAEIEALRILRSWIEDEAKKNQARAKVLEEVARRWKWDDQS
ncbi:hypothetical protein LguiA_032506 [Lonicera macranthoides]